MKLKYFCTLYPLKYYISKFGQDLKFSTKYKNPNENK